MDSPTAAVIVAALDEAETIESVITAAGRDARVTEIIVADGGSTDGTTDIVERLSRLDDRIRLLANPDRHQSAGLNLAARTATTDLLVRMDAHTDYADDYVARSIATWRPRLAVGGPMRAEGTGPWSEAIANAMHDPWAVGPARFRHATNAETVDTVYLGTFARDAFLEIGGYRRFPSGTVEDADFYHRWRARGWLVQVDPAIRSTYHPRTSWRALWRQYLRYGVGKAELLWINRRFPSPRALAPAGLVAGLGVGAILSLPSSGWSLLIVVPWALVLARIAVSAPSRRMRTAIAAGTMHLAYGVGVWRGLLSGRPRVERLGRTNERTGVPNQDPPSRDDPSGSGRS